MTSTTPDGQPVRHWLKDRQGPLRTLLDHAERLSAATQRLHAHFDSAWARSLRVANHRDGTLVLYANSAAALIHVRAHQDELLDTLAPCLGIRPSRLTVKVVPRYP